MKTAGPWFSGFVKDGWGLASRGLRSRCVVFVQNGDGGILPSIDDARLLAAAPELQEACRLALVALRKHNDPLDQDAIRMLQNALTKSECG